MDALTVHRLQFAFTITYHYLFPQLTIGLGLLIVILKTVAFRDEVGAYDMAARFWARIFGINFVLGVVTGIPMEFQFGTNWARFSRLAGGVIGQTLAMEGLFAFFLESAFLGMFLFGEKRLGRFAHWCSAVLVFLGSWVSGYFIVVTNGWMQHPVGYTLASDGTMRLDSFRALLLNPWALWQYAHNMAGAVVTGSFVMSAVGAYYLLARRSVEFARIFLRTGVTTGLLFATLLLLPTGDQQGKMVALNQPATLAAMESLFRTEQGAPLVILGQPNVDTLKIDNPLTVPRMLSFLTYRRWEAEVRGLDSFPRDLWPDNIPLLYYSYHIMVGLGTFFLAILSISGLMLWRGRLYRCRWLLWILMLGFPFPYIANTAGWMTAELGRQPWVVYGLVRTERGFSHLVSAGNAIFTLLGFMGLYGLLSLLFVALIWHEIARGPEAGTATH
jgi:cytochrome d ubiquinol oxidase subunit I